jgi:internalin A
MRAVTNKPVPDNVCSEDIDNNEKLCEKLARTEVVLGQTVKSIIGKDKCEANLDGDSFKDFPVEYIFFHKEGSFYYCFTLAELKGILKTAREHKPKPIKPRNPYTRQPLDEVKIREWINQREDLFDEVEIEPIVESTSARYNRMFNELFEGMIGYRPSLELFMKNFSVDYEEPTAEKPYITYPNPENPTNKKLVYDLITKLNNLYLDNRYYITIPGQSIEKIRTGRGNPYYAFIDLISLYTGVHGMNQEEKMILNDYISKNTDVTTALDDMIVKRNAVIIVEFDLTSIKRQTNVDLSNRGLTALPDDFGSLVNLKVLKLFNNQLTDLPESFGGLSRLTTLDLAGNQLITLPDSFGSLLNLTTLNLNRNQLTILPESFRRLSKLITLDLEKNKLTILPASIEGLFNLSSLNLAGNQITILPESFGRLSKLTELNLNRNQLTTLPESFGRLSNLKMLYLYDNKLLTLPESFGGLSKLYALSLNKNQLTTLPESFGRLSKLYTVNLSNNQLTDLPESFGGLSRLTILTLAENQLTTLPESFGRLRRLTSLKLAGNQITTLPESFGGLYKLTGLNLAKNQITTLPESFGGLYKLKELDLSTNQITTLPESLRRLSKLKRLDLNNNRMTQDEINRIYTVLRIPTV